MLPPGVGRYVAPVGGRGCYASYFTACLLKFDRFSAVLDGQAVEWQSGKCHTIVANVPVF